jgi:putative membrane protein
MHPLVQALLYGSWEWRLEVLLLLALLGTLYVIGWRRLRAQSSNKHFASKWKLVSYLSGIGLLAWTLLSPLDRLGGQLFFVHMAQHMLHVQIAAPLILLANPFPFMLWALPGPLRLATGSFFLRDSVLRRLLTWVTNPLVAWLTFIIVFLGWHDPTLYNLALYYNWVHDLQHITFFIAALLYWWPIIQPAPHIRKRMPEWMALGYLLATVPPNMVVGVSIAFASDVMVSYYATVPRLWGFTVLQDQQLAGAIMWIQGSEMYIWVALYILARLFARKGKSKTPPSRAWDSAEHMIAPGLEGRLAQQKLRKLQESKNEGMEPSEARVRQPASGNHQDRALPGAKVAHIEQASISNG